MAQDYIPAADLQFDQWQLNFTTYLQANLGDLGLVAGDVTGLTDLRSAWNNALVNHNTGLAAARSARQAKDDARKVYEVALRTLVRRLQASAEVSDEERRLLGITVADDTPTAIGPGAAATRPLASVDTSERLRHTIEFRDEGSPTRRAKPAGVMGCEIWVKIGDPAPTDGSQCQMLALDTSTPYVIDYEGDKAGQKAHYMLRWVTTRGDRGPWSETVSATIGG
jgi:hypothetical protein